MGASNDNLDEVLKTDSKKVGAIKIFMGLQQVVCLLMTKCFRKHFQKSKC